MAKYKIEATVWSDEEDEEKFGNHVDEVLWGNFDDILPPGLSVHKVT